MGGDFAGVCEMGERGQKVQTSSFKFWGYNVQYGDCR